MSKSRTDVPELKLGEGLAAGKFAQQSIVSYRTTKGELLVGVQVQPKLEAPAPQPRDIVVLIDNSASQAGVPYNEARRITAALNDTLGKQDQLSIWVVSTPSFTKCLTKDAGTDFQAPKAAKISSALDKLEKEEYCAGATDLKNALKSAIASFDIRSNRQPVILLLGDGESAYSPISEKERYQLAQEMIAQKIGFYTIPLGARLDSQNLNGFATWTGGAVVRLQAKEEPKVLCDRLLSTISTPVLYPTKFELTEGTLETYPTKLPPMRADNPTLMVGKVKPDATSFGLTIEGTVAGKPVKVALQDAIGKPQSDNFFLASMVQQWSKSDLKAAAAILPANRALSYSEQQTRLALEEYLTQANWAMGQDRLDAAEKLFVMAQMIDPDDFEAKTGLGVLKKLQEKKITRPQLLREIERQKTEGLKIVKSTDSNPDKPKGEVKRVDLSALLIQAEQQPPANPMVPGNLPATGDQALLQQAQAQRALAEQQLNSVVEETIRRARALLNSDPDGSYELLKRQKSSVVDNPEISQVVKQKLATRLDEQMRDVDARGRGIKQRLQEETDARIRNERLAAERAEQRTAQEKTRERVRAFVSLMNQARFEEAYKESLVLQQENIAKGLPIPVEATAAYAMALNAMNLREVQELRRIREERFLITMMQVEKSHVPYPDEPPVHFPPATVWKQLSDYRKNRYDYTQLGPDTPQRTKDLISKMSKVVDIDKAIEAPLKDVLEFLSDRFDLTLIINDAAFKALEPPLENVGETRVKLPKMPGVTLSTVLRLVLSAINGTYLIRRDFVEITTGKEAIREKAVRAYEVADLVIPIPSSVNSVGLQQNLQVLGGTFSFGNLGSPFSNPFGFAGGVGIQGIGGGAGGAGLGLGGGGLQQGGLANFNGFGGGGNNQGFGGGIAGFGGGQLGQFGNLGGQFGLQGGDTSALLIGLIRNVIARGEWSRLPGNIAGQLQGQQPGFNNPGMMAEDPDSDTKVVPDSELNSLDFYKPAMALVVRGTSRIHARAGGGLLNPGAGGGNMGFNNLPDGRDVLVFRPHSVNNPNQVAKVEEKKKIDPEKEYAKLPPKPVDPRTMWQIALGKEQIVDKIGVVVALCDFLAGVHEFGHAAELLKANLRHGFTNEPWVFEGLAIALKESGGTSAEIERVRLSDIDLDPRNPQAYLKAAKAVADLGQPERALAFCKQASALRPDLADPYANALVYLEKSKKVDSDAAEWAIGNLLRHEWSTDKEMYYNQAASALKSVRTKLEQENRMAELNHLSAAVTDQQHRDLVIELRWQGQADLDLRVLEPIGSTCSNYQKQTAAGSALVGDLDRYDPLHPESRSELYTVVEAFNGSYEVTVDTVWGRPLSGKAQLKITYHQGTPEERTEYQTISIDKKSSVKVTLTGGRRTTLAAVPPPIAPGHPDKEKVKDGSSLNRAVAKLRALADPTYTADPMSLRAGGASSAGARVDPMYDFSKSAKPTGHVSFETKVNSTVGTDLKAKTEIVPGKTGDEIHVKVMPVFDTVDLHSSPNIVNPLIPGGNGN
jgi:tetratricopeptide (TPR) repeat protein